MAARGRLMGRKSSWFTRWIDTERGLGTARFGYPMHFLEAELTFNPEPGESVELNPWEYPTETDLSRFPPHGFLSRAFLLHWSISLRYAAAALPLESLGREPIRLSRSTRQGARPTASPAESSIGAA
jgi:hypothetical protein